MRRERISELLLLIAQTQREEFLNPSPSLRSDTRPNFGKRARQLVELVRGRLARSSEYWPAH
jgi:hypothetical protein